MSNVEQAYQDYKQGMKYKDIAKKYGVSENTVKSWKRRQWLQYEKGCTPKETKVAHKVASAHKKKMPEKVCDLTKTEIKTLSNESLTEQQRLFCLNYARTFNATTSYMKAYGCTYNSAMTSGARLLGIAKIQDEIRKIKQEKAIEKLIEPSDIFQKYLEIAFNDLTDYLEFGTEEDVVIGAFGPVQITDENGKKVNLIKKVNRLHFKESNEVDGTLISEVKQGRDGAYIKIPDRLKALEWLSNHLDMGTAEQRAKLELLKAQTKKLTIVEEEPETYEDDGFLEALNSSAKEDWEDEETKESTV